MAFGAITPAIRETAIVKATASAKNPLAPLHHPSGESLHTGQEEAELLGFAALDACSEEVAVVVGALAEALGRAGDCKDGSSIRPLWMIVWFIRDPLEVLVSRASKQLEGHAVARYKADELWFAH